MRRGGGYHHTLAALLTGKRPGIPCTGPVWTGVENLSLTGVRTLNHPACSELLFQLQYTRLTNIWVRV
jgi:hypothetical protein